MKTQMLFEYFAAIEDELVKKDANSTLSADKIQWTPTIPKDVVEAEIIIESTLKHEGLVVNKATYYAWKFDKLTYDGISIKTNDLSATFLIFVFKKPTSGEDIVQKEVVRKLTANAGSGVGDHTWIDTQLKPALHFKNGSKGDYYLYVVKVV